MPEFGEREWKAARAELASCRNQDEVRESLARQAQRMLLAADIGDENGPRLGDKFWGKLGIEVKEKEMPCDGAHYETRLSRLVWVRTDSSKLRRRFTIAHEVGHLLLQDLRTNDRCVITSSAEEDFCDRFASWLLMPRHLLLPEVQGETTLTIELATGLCRRFGVNYQPLLMALSESGVFPNFGALMVRRRGRPDRLDQVDYRREACPMPPIYLAPNRRLTSAGFAELTRWASKQKPGSTRAGRSENVDLELWLRGGQSGRARGRANWEGRTLADDRLLVILDTSELTFQWSKRKRR